MFCTKSPTRAQCPQSAVMSLRHGVIDWITNEENHVIGGHHRLILMDIDGSNPRQLLPDNEHTGTLEYFDW